MTKNEFVRERSARWKEYEQLIVRASTIGRSRFTVKELEKYSRLMREVAHDLAFVRGQEWGLSLDGYLNDLAVRGYNNFYRVPRSRVLRAGHFLFVDYPRLLRRRLTAIALGCLLFFMPFFFAWSATYYTPSLAQQIVGAETLDQMDEMYGENGGISESEENSSEYIDSRSYMFGFYILNNIGIAFQTFALGLTFAVGTVYKLLSNGIAIGAAFGHTHAAGNGARLFQFVITHGSFELTAIGIAGGAGLILGDALIHPGQRTLRESLRFHGLDAIQIAAGAGVMLFVAAGLEAFWSPAPINPFYKYVVGVFAWLAVIAYILFSGRSWRERSR